MSPDFYCDCPVLCKQRKKVSESTWRRHTRFRVHIATTLEDHLPGPSWAPDNCDLPLLVDPDSEDDSDDDSDDRFDFDDPQDAAEDVAPGTDDHGTQGAGEIVHWQAEEDSDHMEWEDEVCS